MFIRELGTLENIDKSAFMKSASKLWALMLDEEKDMYKAYAATGMSRENCTDNKKRNVMGNCVYVSRGCKEGTEKNPMTLLCQEKCPDGTKLNLMGNCVNKYRKAPKPCPGGKERTIFGDCVIEDGLREVVEVVRKMKDVPKSAVMAVALAMWEEMSPAAKASYTRKAAVAEPRKPRYRDQFDDGVLRFR